MAENQVIVEFVSDTSGLKAAADQLLALGQISKEQYEAFTKANKSAEDAAKRATKAETDLTKATQQATKPAKELSDQYRDLVKIVAGGVIEEVGKDFNLVAKETEKATKQFASAKAELRELRNQITSGALSGEQLEIATQRAAELQDKIGDVGDEIRKRASDTRTFDLVVEGVQGMTAAFTVAQSASALFGEQNKEVEKALLKVQAALALSTSVQQLANIATTKGGIATVFAAKAQAGYATVVGTSTGAMKAFRIALAATGIGALVLLIGALVANWDKLSKVITDTFPSLKKVTEFFSNFRQIAAGAIGAVIEGFKGIGEVAGLLFAGEFSKAFEAAKNITNRMEAKYISEKEAKNKEILLSQSIKSRKFQIDLLEAEGKDVLAKKLQLAKDELTLLEETEDDYRAKMVEIAQLRKQIRDKQAKEAKDAIDKEREAYKEKFPVIEFDAGNLDDQLKQAFGDLASRTDLPLDMRIAFYKRMGLSAEQIAEQIAKGAKEGMEKVPEVEVKLTVKKRGEEIGKDMKEAVDKAIPYINEAMKVVDASFAAAAESLRRNTDERLNQLDLQKQNELQNSELTAAQREAIEKKYNRKQLEIRKKTFEQEKQMKLAEAAINTALGVTALISKTPPPNPLFFVGLAAIIATSAIQTAMIASQKFPGFAKGTKKAPAGMKWVGEQGPELINDKGGYAIIPNRDAMQIAQKWNVPTLPSVSDDIQQNLVMPAGIDYSRLARTLAMELKNNPQTNIQFDKSGFTSYIISQSQRKQILNNRYAS